jgi:acetate kinase
LTKLGEPSFVAVGHRVVHGGRDFVSPTRIDAGVLDVLRRLEPLAPLHLPPQIAAIEAVSARGPDLLQVACFDTAFHRRMPEVAQRFPLPEWAWDAGICRFGFHGLSYEHAVDVLGDDCGRVVIAHLGHGASMAAVHDGAPIDTTMAFTPAAGLMMGTRTGDLDPGVVVHLMRERGMSADDVDDLVNHESGLLGVSGTTGDMRELLDARRADPRAARAVGMFCRTARKTIGALAAALGGLDQLVFTGGIGEHAAPVRAEICDGLEHLGIRIDPGRNAAAAPVISAGGANCTVRIIPADEDRVIAHHTASIARALLARP